MRPLTLTAIRKCVLKRGDEWTDAHDRFWALVNRDGPVPAYRPELGPCWLWIGAADGGGCRGYGKWRRHKGEPKRYVHRFALSCVEALVPGLEVDHLCRVLLCCNPRHLEQVTPAENRRRQAEAQPQRERCRNDRHDLTPDNVRVRVRDGRQIRECLACWTEREARRPKRTRKKVTA